MKIKIVVDIPPLDHGTLCSRPACADASDRGVGLCRSALPRAAQEENSCDSDPGGREQRGRSVTKHS